MRRELAYAAVILGACGSMMAAMHSAPSGTIGARAGLATPAAEAFELDRNWGDVWNRGTAAPGSFVNWETPHVHPLDLTPDGTRLLAVNTADNRLEVFGVVSGEPRPIGSVPVGLDPVSVRALDNSTAIVVNHISDSLSIVDLDTMHVVRTVATADEPCDAIVAGSPGRVFVSCSQANRVQVFDPAAWDAGATEIELEAEDPRALAVSPDGSTVYAAIFDAGNRTTILGGGLTMGGNAYPRNVVSDFGGPWGGQNPPPNDGDGFTPEINQDNPNPIRVGLIVRQDDQGRWMDDNGGDWTDRVSGQLSFASDRPVGWTLVDHDLAVIDAASLSVSYVGDLMTTNMALGVNPASGEVVVVGTEATNEIRFEPNLNGRFIRVRGAMVGPGGVGGASVIADLNPHLAYTEGPEFLPIDQSDRDRSIGDPRAVVFDSSGTRGYVAGMGSNNVVVIDDAAGRAGLADTIEVGQGPTGLALDEARGRLYVMNKFDASITTVDTSTELAVSTVAFHDPTPDAVRDGRVFLYGTHETSGLGQASCASCHIDGRMDHLAWDLGDPAGEMKAFNQNCADGGCRDWHPMKGPMTTQTLQDIVGKEPHHWRADREGIEAFGGAFQSILGDDAPLEGAEMQAFEDTLASMHFPPNPHRTFENGLPTDMVLDGHYTTGRFAPPGQPLPNGNAQRALDTLYRASFLDGFNCVTCHTLPTGMGTEYRVQGFSLLPPGPVGPNGERHHQVSSLDGSTNISIKIPQLRNMHEKTGFNTTQLRNTAGFGYLHDGSVDSIERFLAEPVFGVVSDQEVADLTAMMLAFSGSNLPSGSPVSILEPLGPESQDTHAAVGAQATHAGGTPPAIIADMLPLAQAGAVDLVVKGAFGGEPRGFVFTTGSTYQSDRAGETASHAALLAAAGAGAELTWTVVPAGSGVRIGIDRDSDGFFDRDETDSCADPADAASTPVNTDCCPADLAEPFGVLDLADIGAFVSGFTDQDPIADINGDGIFDLGDVSAFVTSFLAGCP
jgi:DNA-binding beta-propeller fold protein YncE